MGRSLRSESSQGRPRLGQGAVAAAGDRRTLRWFQQHILRMVMLLLRGHTLGIHRPRRMASRRRMDILQLAMATHRQATLCRTVIRRLATHHHQAMGPMGLRPLDILRRLGMGRDRLPPARGCWAGKMAG